MTPTGVRRVLAEWLRQSAPAARPTVGSSVAVAICASYQTFLVASIFLSDAPVGAVPQTWWGSVSLVVVLIGAAFLLLWSPGRPLTVLLVECGLYAVASAMQSNNSLVFPLLFALYGCVSRADFRRLLSGLAAVMAVMTASAVLVSPAGGFAVEFAGQLVTAVAATAVAIAARSVRGWRLARRRADQEQERSRRLGAERDRAVFRSQIAAELHDSVGHGLTTIIALTEGLADATGDPQIDDALAGINQVARESLADTRRAVRALAGDAHGTGGEEHGWAEISGVLAHVRALGVAAALTETGHRPGDPVQADLCFTLTREALTNAVRHTRGLTSVVVSWDHRCDGSLAAAIRNDGTPVDEGDEDAPRGREAGTGLMRLRARVEAAGGILEWGPGADQGWVVTAVLPASDRDRQEIR